MSKLISIQEKRFFCEEELFEHVKRFNFPRICGTKGEKKAVALTTREFKQIGFDSNKISTQNFKFSDFYSKLFIKFIILLNLMTIFITLFISLIDLLIIIMFFAAFAIFLIFLLSSLREKADPGFWGKSFGNKISATNVYVKVPASRISEKNAGNIVISAHLDTKSQSYRTLWRIIAFNLWLFGTIAFAILYLLQFLYETNILRGQRVILSLEMFNITILCIPIIVISFVIISSNCMLLLLHTGNSSYGALDNASGMAIVFELSRYFKNNPLKNFNVWFVQFSAEELGTMGSRLFLKENESYFKKNLFFQFNFDMVSCLPAKNNHLDLVDSYGFHPRSNFTKLVKNYLMKVAKEEVIFLKSLKFPVGAHTDSVPFRSKKFDAIDFVTLAATKYAHTKQDTPDKVDPSILRKACILTQRTLSLMEEAFMTILLNNVKYKVLCHFIEH
ncbi:MAG: M28 family metallopeptidase [Promethearchaeota archaeon]